MFHLDLETANAAFADPHGPMEVAAILEGIAEQLRDGYTSGYPRESNGNTVGYWRWTPEEVDADTGE